MIVPIFICLVARLHTSANVIMLLNVSFYSGGDDFIELNETITLRNDSENCIGITLRTDLLVETNETFTVMLSTDDPAISFNRQSAEVTIIDNTGMLSYLIL